jgi:hypothetical protein
MREGTGPGDGGAGDVLRGRSFRQNDPQYLGSPSTTYALLLCADCPVRRECLQAALDPPRWAVREDEYRALGENERVGRTFGVWGGTVELERHVLRDLPVEDALETLESTFPKRPELRLAAYQEGRRRLQRTTDGSLRPRPPNRSDRRIDELLAKGQVKTSHLGPGPGRGHKGPIALYAERHGVSRSAAWRRLRAA